MSTIKRVAVGDYNLTTLPQGSNPLGNVVITTNTLTLNGNLVITGNSSQNIDQNNPTITLNANLTVANVPYPGSSGIIVNRGSEVFTEFFWNEVGTFQGTWTLSDAAGAAGIIATSQRLLLEEITPNPEFRTGFVNVTAYTAGDGKTGIFVNTNDSVGELITAAQSKKYALIFG